ncbi:hypothetical protein HOH45_08190 [bacterium]|nr:hypothetical protein [bacterium]
MDLNIFPKEPQSYNPDSRQSPLNNSLKSEESPGKELGKDIISIESSVKNISAMNSNVSPPQAMKTCAACKGVGCPTCNPELLASINI